MRMMVARDFMEIGRGRGTTAKHSRDGEGFLAYVQRTYDPKGVAVILRRFKEIPAEFVSGPACWRMV